MFGVITTLTCGVVYVGPAGGRLGRASGAGRQGRAERLLRSVRRVLPAHWAISRTRDQERGTVVPPSTVVRGRWSARRGHGAVIRPGHVAVVERCGRPPLGGGATSGSVPGRPMMASYEEQVAQSGGRSPAVLVVGWVP
jgi:hypothetical protein